MSEVKFQIPFNIDYGVHYAKILEQKHKVLDYETKIALNAKLRLEREASQKAIDDATANPNQKPAHKKRIVKFDRKHDV
jgi:hypothetical protein